MKKIAIAAAVTAAFSAGAAHAFTLSEFANGFVVPHVVHNGPSDTTAVGIVAQNAAAIYWAFFDQNSKHVKDGCFTVTANQYKPFVWSDNAGVGLEGQEGYLVFAVGDSADSTGKPICAGSAGLKPGSTIAGNAFQVNLNTQNADFVPVISGLTMATGTNLTSMNADSLTGIAGAVQVGALTSPLVLRYTIGNGDQTRIYLWSTGDLGGGTATTAKSYTINMYDDQQNRASLAVSMVHKELEVIDPSTIAGRPSSFTDGFITIGQNELISNVGTSAYVFGYSMISSPYYGATQTLLGHIAK